MAGRARRAAQYHDGPVAAQRYEQGLGRVLSVSKEELAKREDAYQESRAHKDRPGPRRKK
jgi:hypothetical protein